MIQSLDVSAGLMRFQLGLEGFQQHQTEIYTLLEHELLLLPVCYAGHAITFVRYKNYFVGVFLDIFSGDF